MSAGEPNRGPSVVVIGGGIIGLSVAWRLGREGVDVTVLERDRPGEHASSAAAGMLSPLKEAEETGPFLDIGLRSFERYPGFVEAVEAASGVDVSYRADGRLDIALDDDGADALRRQQKHQRDAGYESRLLGPDEVRGLEPALTDVALGLVTDHDHQVDNVRLLRALRLVGKVEGVDVRDRAEVTGVRVEDERVTGVTLAAGGAVPADVVVVAAGPWSGRLELPTPLPVRPVRGQVVTLGTIPPPLGRVVWAPGCYLVPRSDGRLIVGSTMEEAGFASHVTADGVRGLLNAAVRAVPGLADAPIYETRAGLRPASADGMPIIGRDPAVEGLLYATAHFRNGILLAPETAERVAALILEDADEEPAFSPGRFAPERS